MHRGQSRWVAPIDGRDISDPPRGADSRCGGWTAKDSRFANAAVSPARAYLRSCMSPTLRVRKLTGPSDADLLQCATLMAAVHCCLAQHARQPSLILILRSRTRSGRTLARCLPFANMAQCVECDQSGLRLAALRANAADAPPQVRSLRAGRLLRKHPL